ncbi:MAG: aldo/keto reductase [Chloroflexi bacterium]|nr:aldo/keto reductase [Chloroflexota bacterium]
MRTIRLGRTNLVVSEIGFGGIPIQRLTTEEAVAVVRRCLDLGVTFLDTAHGYTTSEERIGQAIAGRREGLVLASKSPARDGATFVEHLELSLKRLGVSSIDIYQFHGVSTPQDYERILAPGGPLDRAREAQAAGRIGHIGITTHSLALAQEFVRSGHFETVMFPFNFISTEPETALLPLCRAHDVALLAMKPMGGGVFEDARPAFHYLRQFPDVLPVVGIENVREIEEIVALTEEPAELAPEDAAEIARLRRELGTRFCRRCDYCQPCPQGIAISTVLSLRGFSRRFPRERVFGSWGQEIIRTAQTCQECGECESRCPYNLAIRDLLKEAIAWYESALAAYIAAKSG